MMTIAPRPAWKRRWLESRTGPLDPLRGRKVVCLIDLENLVYGARDLNFRLDLAALTETLCSVSSDCVLHAVFSDWAGDASPRRDELEERGWCVHINPIGTNADSMLLFVAGKLLSSSPAEIVLYGSGDGDLVSMLSTFAHLDRREVMTLSLPGSTSQRLDARHNPVISHNIEIGRDCLSPFSYEGGYRNALIHA